MAERDLVGIFLTLQHEFGDRVHAVADDQWQGPTPNASWTVADLVAHLITEHRWAEPLVRGLDIDAAAAEVDRARTEVDSSTGDPTHVPVRAWDGASYAKAWDEVAAESAAAFSAPGALDRPVHLTRGDTVAHGYLRELIFDLTVHTWDLGQAIGYPGALPADIVRAVWEESHQFGDLSASGVFDHPVSVPDDAPVLDRLIAMTGRDPRWADTVFDER